MCFIIQSLIVPTDENIKSSLWTLESRITITIMTNRHQHHNFEEDIVNMISQLYTNLTKVCTHMFSKLDSETF